jgi:hypothetical protein
MARRVMMQRFLLMLPAAGIGWYALIKPVHIDDTVVLHVAQCAIHRARLQASFSGLRSRNRWRRLRRIPHW